jgi:hypothetical protein
MTPFLTAPNPELEHHIRQTPSGMMFWAGTCSTPGTRCGDCRHYGYSRPVRNAAGNVVRVTEYPNRCALYHKHRGKPGDKFDQSTPACKYFEGRSPPA